jgi:branched-chain amino acid transport system ATP-binding protein
VNQPEVAAATAADAPQPSGDHLLEVVDLHKHFGGVRAVDGCTFSVGRGQLVGLIGPNGAGKSTVVEMLSGMIAPDSGQIIFDGRQIGGLPPHKVFRTGIARCFQLAKVWPMLTVVENLLIAAPQEGLDTIRGALFQRRRLRHLEQQGRERALQVMEKYGLIRLRNDYAYTLSGGQMRLLEFARIAMCQPKLALLDEPMAGVNPVLQVQIEDGIRSLLANGATVLLIEHNLAFIERLCHEVIVMVNGRVASVGQMADHRNNAIIQDAYLGAVNV